MFSSHRFGGIRVPLVAMALLVSLASAACAQDLVLGDFRLDATMHSIGMEWDLAGDPDHDAVCTVRYRAAGSETWRQALDLYRIDSNGYDMFGGSVLFLEPGTGYEIELAASDPDGGGDSKSIEIATRSLPAIPEDATVYHVVPGAEAGGGDGSEADPFRGISAADDHAAPGTVFLLHAGEYPTTGDATYSGYTRFDESGTSTAPIVWKAAGDGPASFPGGAWIMADHVWLEGLHFAGPGSGNGLLTYSDAVGGVIKGNRFTGWKQSINLEHATDFYIADNTIVGVNDPDTSDFSGEGIEGFRTSGHVIAHNSISLVGDGISVGGSNIDIFGNDIFSTSDDGVELDNCRVNVRMWGNRIHNALAHGISFQPMDGAPWYILRNQVAGNRALKLVDNPTLGRMLIAHNTFVGRGAYLVTFAHELAYVQSANNLWIHATPGDIWEAYGGDNTHWRTDLDYDGFYWHPDTDFPFYWGGVNYPSFSAFQDATGLEPHAVVVDIDRCFEELELPLEGVIPAQHMLLAAGAGAIDAGRLLPNVNDAYNGSLPDLGAFEFGAEVEQYGPRSDDTTSNDRDPDEPGPGDDMPGAGIRLNAYPNPFNPRTTLTFSLPSGGPVTIDAYDLDGSRVANLARGEFTAGPHTLSWNGIDDRGRTMPSGVYLLRLETEERIRITKVTLTR